MKQATIELTSRGISRDEQLETFNQIKLEEKKFDDHVALDRSQESYSYLDMLFMFLNLPGTILRGWRLKADGFHTKYRQRIYVIGVGCIIWVIGGFYLADSWKIQQIEWQNEVNNQDIYAWERDYYSDEEFAKRRSESVELAIQTVRKNEANGQPIIVFLDSDTLQNTQIKQLRDVDPLNIRDVAFEVDPQSGESHQIRVKLVKKPEDIPQ